MKKFFLTFFFLVFTSFNIFASSGTDGMACVSSQDCADGLICVTETMSGGGKIDVCRSGESDNDDDSSNCSYPEKEGCIVDGKNIIEVAKEKCNTTCDSYKTQGEVDTSCFESEESDDYPSAVVINGNRRITCNGSGGLDDSDLMKNCGAIFNDDCEPGYRSDASSGQCCSVEPPQNAKDGDSCGHLMVYDEDLGKCVASIDGKQKQKTCVTDGKCPCDFKCENGYCQITKDEDYLCDVPRKPEYGKSDKTQEQLIDDYHDQDYEEIEKQGNCYSVCSTNNSTQKRCFVEDKNGKKAEFNLPDQSCGANKYCFGGKCQSINSDDAREEDGDDLSNEDENNGSTRCLYSCQGDNLLKRCFDKSGNPTTVDIEKCIDGCKNNKCKNNSSQDLSNCQYTCDPASRNGGRNSYLEKECIDEHGLKSVFGSTCPGKDCSKCFADRSQFPDDDEGDDKDEDKDDKDDEDVEVIGGNNNNGNSNTIGGSNTNLSNQTNVTLSGDFAKGGTSGKGRGGTVNQKMTVNSSSIVNSKAVENGFQLTQESSQDWEFVGGEDNTPLALWTSESQSFNDLRNNKDSFYKSRILYYTMICESLDCQVVKKPSYLEVENISEDSSKCVYDFKFNNDAPEGEEFEVTFNKEAKCQFEVRDQNNSASVTSQVRRDPENENYNFKGVYVGVVPQLADQIGSSSHSGNVVGSESSLLLSKLEVSGYNLTPQFYPTYSYYAIDLNEVISDVDIIAEPEDPKAVVEIQPFVDLLSSDNSDRTAYISVISPDGKRRKTYSIIFNLKRNKAYLSDLSTKVATIMPEFKKDFNNYQVDLSNQKNLLDDQNGADRLLQSIEAVPLNSSHEIEISPLDFESGNYFSALINVHSQDGLKLGNYYLTFYASQRMWHF